jgi:predicted ATP-grasp superfamily ATP-dependent carboligase
MPYPYIVKPADSSSFHEAFGRKVFLIESADDLEEATARLRGRDLEVMIQDIVPGREIYSFYAYYDRKSEPLALCGYDKTRQYEPDFGSGSFCKSIWRPEAARPALQLLREMSYHGFAEPELKKDPRDGQYKLLEINARTTLQNRLPAACGVDIEYAAYRDCLGRKPDPSVRPRGGVLWVDDFTDQKSFLIHLKRRDLSRSEIVDSLKPRKVHSVAAWDDPLPFVVRVVRLLWAGFRRVLLPRATKTGLRRGHRQVRAGRRARPT